MLTLAAVAMEEVRSSKTESSRLFKHCRGSYSSIKNEKKLYLGPIISQASSNNSSNWWPEKEDREES